MKSVVALCLFALLVVSCGGPAETKSLPDQSPVRYLSVRGEAQGTTFQISYQSETSTDYSAQVDSILRLIDQSMSTYVQESLISRVNRADTIVEVDEHFADVLGTAINTCVQTEGAFDVTVMPLVRAWGFHHREADRSAPPDSAAIDSLLQLVGRHAVGLALDGLNGNHHWLVEKSSANTELDMNGIAQGYTVDVLAKFLAEQRITNYMVELGGEVRAAGVNPTGQLWSIGVDKPEASTADNRTLQAIVELDNLSLATSGNYRKFYERDGVKYAHTIDPRSGYPVQHSLLSATVLCKTCIGADAFATAFMVMGVEATQEFLRNEEGLEAYLIYSDSTGELQTWMSEGMRSVLQEKE